MGLDIKSPTSQGTTPQHVDDTHIDATHDNRSEKQEESKTAEKDQATSNVHALRQGTIETESSLKAGGRFRQQALADQLQKQMGQGGSGSTKTQGTGSGNPTPLFDVPVLSADTDAPQSGLPITKFASNLKGNSNFKKLDPDVQKQILKMEQDSPGVRQNLEKLVKDPDFAKLSPNAQKLALGNLAKDDSPANLEVVKQGMKDSLMLEGNSAFQKLDPEIKNQMLFLLGQKGMDSSTRSQLLKLLTSPDMKDPAAASAFIKGLPWDKLVDLAGTKGGGKLVEGLHKQLETLGPKAEDVRTRLHNAQTASLYMSGEDFGKLPPNAQKDVRDAFEKFQHDRKANARIIAHTALSDTGSLSDATRKILLNSAGNPDPAIADAVLGLVTRNDFKNVSDPATKNMIENMQKFTQTESYKKMSPDDRKDALQIIGRLSIHITMNPTVTAQNTLDKLVSGKVPMEIYRDPSSKTMGEAGNGKMQFNARHPSVGVFDDKLVETAAHEVNHILNGDTRAGTHYRFLDEYRAWTVGKIAAGQTPTAQDMKEVIENLATNPPDGSGYDHLRKLYRSNPEFKKVVDEMVRDLNAVPPKITSPEDLRRRMIVAFPRTNFDGAEFDGAGRGSRDVDDPKLLVPGNMDNH